MAIRKKPISKVTTRVNDMLVFIIAIYILLTGLQMWLLFGSINKALYLYNTEIDVMSFATWSAIGSVVIFACLLFFLRYIPLIKTGKLLKGNEKEEEYEY
jgi:putative C4-dicarboxylate transporter, permease